MQPIQLTNIRLLLSLSPFQITRSRHPFPARWKSNQQVPAQPKTRGEQIKKHRLDLHWLQTDVAARIGVSSASVSNWERGITFPSRRMTSRIQQFLGYTPPKVVTKKRALGSSCQTCGIPSDSSERRLFESVCNSFTENTMQSQVNATDPAKIYARCCLFATAV
jgi:transcriptional regulator with XRE-family HTH domain